MAQGDVPLAELALRGLRHIPFSETLIATFRAQRVPVDTGSSSSGNAGGGGSSFAGPTIVALLRATADGSGRAGNITEPVAPEVRAAADAALQAWERRVPSIAEAQTAPSKKRRKRKLVGHDGDANGRADAEAKPRFFPNDKRKAVPEAVPLGDPSASAPSLAELRKRRQLEALRREGAYKRLRAVDATAAGTPEATHGGAHPLATGVAAPVRNGATPHANLPAATAGDDVSHKQQQQKADEQQPATDEPEPLSPGGFDHDALPLPPPPPRPAAALTGAGQRAPPQCHDAIADAAVKRERGHAARGEGSSARISSAEAGLAKLEEREWDAVDARGVASGARRAAEWLQAAQTPGATCPAAVVRALQLSIAKVRTRPQH
jgi:hypothetical protein